MIEKLIKKDKNEQLESVLEKKNIDETTKNLLQGILYKIEISYKDYKKAKVTQQSEKQYVQEIIENIQNKCSEVKTVKFSEKIEDGNIKKALESKKLYIDAEKIISYPIEEKILYAIVKKASKRKIVNNKYGELTMPLSNLINTGASIEKVEVLRDFNGWSWTTVKKEIESIKANLLYQTLQILLGEEFLKGWQKDVDGIIDYYQRLEENITKEYGTKSAEELKKIINKIAIINEAEENEEYKEELAQKLKKIKEKEKKFENVQQYVQEITEDKKIMTKKIKEIEKILSQETRIKEEYKKRNEEAPLEKKIFSIRVLKKQLKDQKQKLIEKLEQDNYLLNPNNYLEIKKQIEQEKEMLELISYTEDEKDEILIKLVELFLKIFKMKISSKSNPEETLKLIYKFRYYILMPFNTKKDIKDIKQLKTQINDIEEKLTKLAKEQKIISQEVPFEVMKHVYKTRIIDLEELYYKILMENNKKYIQIFDENVTEEKFEINSTDKSKKDKKVKIFI